MDLLLSMAKENKSLNHARHNNDAIKYLDKSPNHLDWVITICFYSSLHYVRAILFPISLKTDNGKSYKINHFDEYCKHLDNGRVRVPKHERLLNLVAEKCPDIAWEYNQLLDMSSTARYRDYITDRDMSNQAKKFHSAIKEHCERILS